MVLTYAVFTQQGGSWHLLTDKVDCTAGMVDVPGSGQHGHYDFVAFQNSGRGGFFVQVFSWDGHQYIKKVNWEMSRDILYNRE